MYMYLFNYYSHVCTYMYIVITIIVCDRGFKNQSFGENKNFVKCLYLNSHFSAILYKNLTKFGM